MNAPLVLASASPRRRDILETLGVPFRIVTADISEARQAGEPPADYARRLAREKALEVCERLDDESPRPFVLGADTIVVVDGELLGKPKDDGQAARMLKAIAGRTHHVITAVALGRVQQGFVDDRLVQAEVTIRQLSPEEIARYVDSGEGRDKAGSYAAQGIGAGLVREIRGSYHAVVGLPAVETLELLGVHQAIAQWP